MISHFDHIVLTVANTDRAMSFYTTVLKMEVSVFSDGQKALRFGQQEIHLQLLGEELRNHSMEGAANLCLISEWGMDEVVDHLVKHDVNILEGPVDSVGAQGPIQSVYFNDPDNNLIELAVNTQQIEGDETDEL